MSNSTCSTGTIHPYHSLGLCLRLVFHRSSQVPVDIVLHLINMRLDITRKTIDTYETPRNTLQLYSTRHPFISSKGRGLTITPTHRDGEKFPPLLSGRDTSGSLGSSHQGSPPSDYHNRSILNWSFELLSEDVYVFS